MIQRAAGVRKGGTWCFPGGHVERGETARRAIVREFREELGLQVEATRRLGAVRVGREYVLAVWQVRWLGGAVRPAAEEVADVRWVSLAEAGALSPGLPSNVRVFEMLEGSVADPGAVH
ncbi:MAG TPA: NUDIX domain-containing protein [Phycisphaerae bacterium]|nr:NUDIX domain-containing protein [Phycisphaerae bacterium]